MGSERRQVLIADDEPNLRRVVAAQLDRDGFDVHTAEDGERALEVLANHHVDLVITDLRMPKIDGMGLLKHCTEHYPEVPVIMITAHGTVNTAVEALKNGAFDYVTKPFDRDELKQAVDKAARSRELRGDLYLGTEEERGRYRLIGESEAMNGVYELIDRAADTPSTVLITGESGTGKELIARALHEHSSRKDRPFIRVNCAALPTELIESELFGYQKGAFTGAVTSKPGRFELADGGTLFLDEIGEIPVSMQVKLLRAIQESELERVGGVKTIQVDVRLIAATNRDLTAEIEQGRFREDLYYRLNVVHVMLPPLRERRDDIPLLIEHFTRRFNERLKKSIKGPDAAALEVLVNRPWRGNIRELENVMERSILFCDGEYITVQDLPPDVRDGQTDGEVSSKSDDTRPYPAQGQELAKRLDEGAGLKEAVREATSRVERELILAALKQTHDNVTHAARLLKISRKSLQMKMKELGLREEQS